MWLKFWKRRKPKRIDVPDHCIKKLLTLWDIHHKTPSGTDHLAYYEFWAFAGEKVPETLTGRWKIMQSRSRVYFEEIL